MLSNITPSVEYLLVIDTSVYYSNKVSLILTQIRRKAEL